MRVDQGLADHAAQVRLGDVERESAVVLPLEPNDVTQARFVETPRDGAMRGGELAHRRLELGELVLVASEVADSLGGDSDPQDRVAETFAGELHR